MGSEAGKNKIVGANHFRFTQLDWSSFRQAFRKEYGVKKVRPLSRGFREKGTGFGENFTGYGYGKKVTRDYPVEKHCYYDVMSSIIWRCLWKGGRKKRNNRLLNSFSLRL